ncbi:gluconolactonase [Xaviernesmea oryzae]|uniref:Gluconolactonase n=1 Tax=Xaviernesmea oryzae TaxID=464029 RepID=A0A1Q9B181_9HYPH|nr:L-dopachrome tautomerase-related protein [Xaviernesmea oryzae]OLP61741.1 gluconolactonase [Xaviernesmea oryzae]SEL01488.1 Sugar lactone lactonase YvrE [Xaviernesmea oryzae]
MSLRSPTACFPLALSLAIGLAAPALAQSPALDTLKTETKRLVRPLTGKTDDRLQEVARFDHQVTGVTVAEDGRIFVNFPRWSEDVPVSVAEVMGDGTIKPYPDTRWNDWRNATMAERDPADHFVCVQSVVADQRGSLFVLDPAAPNAEKTVENGPKLVRIDLKTNAVTRTYAVPKEVAGPASYLNDVRIAPDGAFAYMTDSGQPGGLVVLDLNSGKSWRVLSGDPATQMEKDVKVVVDGQPLRRPDGRQPMFNADGIALSKDGQTLYFQALTGKTLYRVPTEALRMAGDNPQAPVKAETVATTEPVDGLWMAADGSIYLSAIGANGIKRLMPDGAIDTVLTDDRLRWPDTFAQGPDGALYVTASHIQDSPWFSTTGWAEKNFTLFRFAPPK